MSDKVKSGMKPIKQMQTFDKNEVVFNEQRLIHYLHYLVSPVSIDAITALLGASSVDTLNLMEKIRKKKIAYEKKDRLGFYFFDNASLENFSRNHISKEETKQIIERVIDFYAQHLDEGREKTLILTDLYHRLGRLEQGLVDIMNAADILHHSGNDKKTFGYYEPILEYFREKPPTKHNVEIYLKAVQEKDNLNLGLSSLQEHLSLLSEAANVAKRYERWQAYALIKLKMTDRFLSRKQYEKAAKCVNDFWKVAKRIGDPFVLRTATLAKSKILLFQGRIFEATDCYEEWVRGMEDFGEHEAVLQECAFVGLYYVETGKIARGIGMVDAVREKAKLLNFQKVILSADLLTADTFIVVRKITEAEAILNRMPLDINGYHLLGRYFCKAYILYTKEDYAGALECHTKAIQHARSIGCEFGAFRPWILEYLEGLSERGFLDAESDGEIEKLLEGGNIYEKGYALRYRALRNKRKGQSQADILIDLRKSERCLNRAGAETELARTWIALGNYFLENGDVKTAHSFLERAWKFFYGIDKSLFPADLMPFMPKEKQLEFTIDRMVEITQSLGTIHDNSSFLERALNVAMDLTMAMRGGFFVLESGQPKIIVSRNIDSAFLNTEGFHAIEEAIRGAVRENIGIITSETNEKDALSNQTIKKACVIPFICMSAELHGHKFGYLCLTDRLYSASFPLENLPFLKMLCCQIAVGLSNIGMYNEMKDLKNRFEEEAMFYKQEMGVATPIQMVVSRSEKIQKMIAQVQQVSPTDSLVLILGETGVGKELIAKAIHNISPRKEGPFIPVNLAALPQELVASELFGHEKGAYTGADKRQKGRFELADGGTIFLDEIGDLPPNMQVKLLRVLQEGSFERLGSSKEIKSNFRVIAATNKNLLSEVERGTFRQDLYFRLNIFPIHVPPLRERKEDIPLLVNHFVGIYTKKLGKRIRRIPDDEIKKLFSYHWPGNVRELEHFVERSVILCNGPVISFPEFEYLSAQRTSVEDFGIIPLADMERQFITKVLALTGWRVGGPNGAASILGLKRQTLFFRMKKLGIKKPSLVSS